MQKLFEVVHEDDELLVVNKPAGLVCHPTKGDEFSSLISRARLHTGNSEPRLVNRLDRETSGIVILAKNSAVAGELGKLMESRAMEKEYLAIVHGYVRDERGVVDAPLGKDERSIVAVKDCVRADGAAAVTEFFVCCRFVRHSTANSQPSTFTLLRVLPRTGRKHQIRIHLAHIGHAIVGDKLYGGDEDLYLALAENRLSAEQRARLILENQALHARLVRFAWRGGQREFRCESSAEFTQFVEKNP
jgi:23S rRNA pseudouridine1911/1915/1917 synthase